MRIPLSVLMFSLSQNAKYESKNIDFLSQYEGVRLYDSNSMEEEGNPNYIYIIPPALFIRNKEKGRNTRHKNITMLCVKGECFANLDDFHPEDSVIIIDPPRTTSYMFNRISDVFENFNRWDLRIHEALLRDASMQELLDITKTYVDHEVVIIDKSFSLLAYRENPTVETDPILRNIIDNGYLTADTMSFLRKNGLFSVKKTPKNPMLSQMKLADGSDLYMLQYIFYVNGNIVGYALSCERNTRPKSNAIDTVGILGHSLGLYFQRESYERHGTTEVYETIISEILNTDSPNLEHFTDKLSYISDLMPEGRFWLLRIDYENKEELPYFFLSWYLRNSVAGMKPFVHEGNLYVLYSGKSSEPSLSKEEKIIFARGFRGMPFAVSVSQMFFSLMDLKRAVWQCDETVHFANYDYQSNRVFFYKDIYLRSLLQKLGENGIQDHYLSPEYEILKQYDEDHNTDLSEVYMKYLENGRNVNQTANAIFLHRNTVLNKVKKANAILQNDCDDYQTMIAYMLTYLKDHM